MTPRFELCSLREIRDGAKILIFGLNTGHTEWDDTIDKWIIEKAQNLQCVSSTKIVENKEIEICDSQGEVPCDYLRLIALRAKCDNYTGFDGVYLPLQYYSHNPDPNVRLWDEDWIQQGIIRMPSNYPFDSVIMSYWASNLGEDGFPVLYKVYQRALERYAKWQYEELMKDYRAADRSKKYMQSAINAINAQDLINKWDEQKRFMLNSALRGWR